MKSLIRAARLLPFLAFCLLGVSSTCMAQQKTGATFQAPGATLYYEVFGSRKGTPLVVVNGGPGAAHDYMIHTTAWRRLANHRPVVFYDQRGTGRSGPLKPGQSCTLADQVEDLDALRAQLGAERMDLLGHSWGGFLIMAYAARHAERVARFVLMGSAPPKLPNESAFRLMDFFPEIAARLQAREAAKAAGQPIDQRAHTRDFVSTMFYSPEKRDAFLAKLSLSGSSTEVESMLIADAKQFDLEPEIRRFQFPALVMNGRFDVLTTPTAAHRIRQGIPGARLVIFERSGHNPFIEEPEEFVRAMEQFLGEPRISTQNRHKPSTPVLGPVKTIEVNGVQLAYVERGRGEPVVLIHPGFLHDYRAWSTQLPAFSRRYRVIAYSMRYRWPNTPSGDGSDLSPSVNAADLVGLIEGLKLGRVHLVGHSGSAGLALRVARDRPDLVRSLVLGEPGAQAFAAGNLEARPLYSPELINDVRQAFERGDTEAAVQMVRETVVGKERAADPGPAWARRMLLDNAWQLKQLWTRGERQPPVTCEEARRIKLPTLLLGGDRSPGIFRLVLDELQKCLPASERGVLPDSSHGLQLENPAAFNKIVLGFLTRHSRPARR